MGQKSPPEVQSTSPTTDQSTSSVGQSVQPDNSQAQDSLAQSMVCEAPSPESLAARQEITDFMSQAYTQTNYVTGNGYGAFDLVYEPNTGACVVNVNLEFDFQNAPPSVLMKYLGSLDLGNVKECFWTDAQKETFKTDMMTQVDRVWSQQHTLNCVYDNPDLDDDLCPTWSDLAADVTCAVNPVSSGGHFKVAVVALPSADNLRSFVSGNDHDTTQTGSRTSPTGRSPTGAEVADPNFQQTGAQFNKHDNVMEDKSSSFDGTTYTVKAGDTLWGIAEHLFRDGSRWKELYEANKAVVGPDPDKILPGDNLTLSVPDTKQVTTAHEFGHMLGLDDQYLGGGGGAGTAGAVNDDGSQTSSVPADEHRIMDGGEEVLAEHYSTILEALNGATAPVSFAI